MKALVKAMMPYEILNLKNVDSVGETKSPTAKDNVERMREYFAKQEKLVKKTKLANVTRPKEK